MFTSLRKLFAFYRLISVSEWGLSSFGLDSYSSLASLSSAMVASRKMQEAQPRIKALREQYPGRDMESRTKLEQEMRKVFKEIGCQTVRFSLADFDSDAGYLGLVPSSIKS